MPRTRRASAVLLPLAFVAASCGGSGSGAPHGATASGPSPTTSPCPTGGAEPASWPPQVPADLPKPPHARLLGTTTTNGVHVSRWETPSSLRDSVLFVVRRLPRAGYVLGRGDAEATEADAPFQHGASRGLLRLVSLGPCRTQWVLATVSATGAGSGPLLSPHSPSASPSPLPFG